MAIGVILFSLNKTYVSDVFSYLFGNMLTIGVYDLVVALALLLITLVFFRKFKRELFLIIVDEELAYTCGVNASFVYYLLVTLFTVSVVIAIKLLGVILVSSLTVIPATVALFFSSRLSAILLISALVSIGTTLVGTGVALFTNLPPGATTALVAGTVFFITLFLRKS